MARENVSYTTGVSIAFGVTMFFGLVLLLVSSTENIVNVDSFETSSHNEYVAFYFIGLPLCILCWCAALKVTDDRHRGKKPDPTIWDNQKARWIEHTVRCLRYLESQGKTPDTSLGLSDDIYAAARKLNDDTDEATVRPLLSALLEPPSALLEPPYETDTFQYVPFYSLVAKRRRIIWDYRDKKGILHSGVVDSHGEALEKAKKFGFQSN